MAEKNPGKIAFVLSLTISVLLIIASYSGIFYRKYLFARDANTCCPGYWTGYS